MNGRPVSPAQYARLSRVAGRVSRVALMGEFSAGKSTLLNLLLGQEVARTQVTATHLPAIWWRRRETGQQILFGYDGRPYATRAHSTGSVDMNDCAMLQIESDAPALDSFEVIDTPGISDPMMKQSPLPVVAGLSDFVLWCTTAVQAWRQSEVSAWDDLPARLARESILVVTGIDRMSEKDRKKVLGRVARETAGRFRAIVPIATLDAVRALEMEDREAGAQLWRDSGGEALLEELGHSLDAAKAHRNGLLARYVPFETPVETAIETPVEQGAETALAPALPQEFDAGDAPALWDQMVAQQPDLYAAVRAFREVWPVNATLDALLILPDPIPDPAATSFQIRGEIEAFSKTAWRNFA